MWWSEFCSRIRIKTEWKPCGLIWNIVLPFDGSILRWKASGLKPGSAGEDSVIPVIAITRNPGWTKGASQRGRFSGKWRWIPKPNGRRPRRWPRNRMSGSELCGRWRKACEEKWPMKWRNHSLMIHLPRRMGPTRLSCGSSTGPSSPPRSGLKTITTNCLWNSKIAISFKPTAFGWILPGTEQGLALVPAIWELPEAASPR